jgi:hypothetical protein
MLADELLDAIERELAEPYEARFMCYRDPKTGITYACEISQADGAIVWVAGNTRGKVIREAHGALANYVKRQA